MLESFFTILERKSYMTLLNITDIPLKNKRVLIRLDLNVPLENGRISSKNRIESSLPSIEYALKSGAAVILMSHLGRPNEGYFDKKYSLFTVANELSKILNIEVVLVENWLNGINILPGQIKLCENVRFNSGESSCDDLLSKKIARLCDIFVMDAFGVANRKHASTYGVAKYAPIVCCGKLVLSELRNLNQVLQNPRYPLLAIVGGSKVSGKLKVLKNLAKKVNALILGGGIANTFLRARGFEIGKSLFEESFLDFAVDLLDHAEGKSISIPLPVDVRVSKSFHKREVAYIKNVGEIEKDDIILDVGPKTELNFKKFISPSKTILWNGPIGVFEFPHFESGTKTIAKLISESQAFSLAGGGDTVSAIEKFKIKNKISYISTGGGSFLDFIEGKDLPAIRILSDRNSK